MPLRANEMIHRFTRRSVQSVLRAVPDSCMRLNVTAVMAILLLISSCSLHPQHEALMAEEQFVSEFRTIMQKHVAPYAESRAAIVGVDIDPSWKEAAQTQGQFANGTDYVIWGEVAARAYLPFDLDLVYPGEIFHISGKGKITAQECRIEFDTPVKSEHGEDWAAYGECVIKLVKECGDVFSHVDADGIWVTNCIDPNQ